MSQENLDVGIDPVLCFQVPLTIPICASINGMILFENGAPKSSQALYLNGTRELINCIDDTPVTNFNYTAYGTDEMCLNVGLNVLRIVSDKSGCSRNTGCNVIVSVRSMKTRSVSSGNRYKAFGSSMRFGSINTLTLFVLLMLLLLQGHV
ncbi:hypothetical protein AX774_g1951 [Zancudomyces culisetae]|uniref:Uncharacterized protein n=1 Tax=Zancudomyces culisetae TaxID=1213189 RepID=A0A1R1PUD9_ZANCU|nr:hypothetical protein AX774_g1951 [Zancudomyces culisetae]|eukprot:OMH84523.1 hypothetical protein AX774_g1951 [Zancudomyces culisetae]